MAANSLGVRIIIACILYNDQCYIIADLERSRRELFKSGLNFKKD
jgi:hypothetical protein